MTIYAHFIEGVSLGVEIEHEEKFDLFIVNLFIIKIIFELPA